MRLCVIEAHFLKVKILVGLAYVVSKHTIVMVHDQKDNTLKRHYMRQKTCLVTVILIFFFNEPNPDLIIT